MMKRVKLTLAAAFVTGSLIAAPVQAGPVIKKPPQVETSISIGQWFTNLFNF